MSLSSLSSLSDHETPNVSRRRNNQMLNAFEKYNDAEFRARFRVSKETVLYLESVFGESIKPPTRRSRAIQPKDQILITLRFYATGSYQRVIGDIFKIEQPTVHRIVHRVTAKIASMKSQYINMPTRQECLDVAHDFYGIANFPRVVGAVDCTHIKINSPAVKQERPPIRAGPHPALRERGRAIPPGTPAKPTRAPVVMPPHVRVRSPLAGYFELEIQPPPIPGMRPPLGSPGGPVPAPKTSMGFVMPIYTICIIVFFVYTLSKILFKRSAGPYETISPDPQFSRRVFRDDSRSSPDKLGPKERDTRDIELEALRARLAETERAMQRIVGQLAARDAEAQDNQTRSYTNGTILHNSGPVHIVASQFQESTKESPPPKETSPEPIRESKPSTNIESTPESKEPTPELRELTPESKEPTPESKEPTPELRELTPKSKEPTPESKEPTPESKEPTPESKEPTPESKEPTPESKEPTPESKEPTPESKEPSPDSRELTPEEKESTPEKEDEGLEPNLVEDEMLKLTENLDTKSNHVKRSAEEFLEQTRLEEDREVQKSTSQLLAEALREESPEEEDLEDHENASVKHEAEDVQEIFLQTEIPQQSRVIVTDFGEDTAAAVKKQPLVVSGKMTLSLIQDAPRDTPEKELESTVDDYTTASGITQPAEEQDKLSEDEEEEIEEEIEIEEIEEEVTDEEEEELQESAPKKK